MDRNFARALPLVLKHEGGWADHPRDPGGATNKGVTLATFRAYVKPGGTKDDLRKITDEQVATVYYQQYWAAVQAHMLPSGVDYAVFDFAVNSGPARAAKYLQKVVGVTQDGKVGPKTIAAAEKMNSTALINRLCDDRLAFLKRIKSKGKRLWDTFGKGWARRVADVRKHAVAMVGDPADVEVIPVDKPTVPVAVDKEVKKQTNWWQWLTGLVGSGGVGLGAVLGADWEAIVAFGVIMLVVLAAILLLRRQLIAAVKDIRKEIEA